MPHEIESFHVKTDIFTLEKTAVSNPDIERQFSNEHLYRGLAVIGKNYGLTNNVHVPIAKRP